MRPHQLIPERPTCSIAELQNGPPTIPVWHQTKASAASALGCSRATAYAMARRGDLPTIRLGHRVVVPVPALLRMLGADQ